MLRGGTGPDVSPSTSPDVGPSTGPALGPVRRFEQIDSTNRYLADEARAGAPHGLVAVAGHQTAGKGRLGRRWDAPPGTNLLVSVLLRPAVLFRPPVSSRPAVSHSGDLVPDLHAFTVAVALSAADACVDVAGVDPGLKWPNDLVVDDMKLAGVLAEAVGVDGDDPAVVVGLGLNIGWPGPGSDAAADELGATSLHRLQDKPSGATSDCDLLLEGVLEHLVRRLSGLLQPLGRARQVDEYRTRCATLGRQVTVEEHSGSFTGRACGISDEGHLLVDTASGRRTVTAGDVVHIRHPLGSPGSSPRSRPQAAPPDMDPGPAS